MADWSRFRVTLPNGTPRPSDGRPLGEVHHVVHLAEARRILEDGRLKAGLVYDESSLNKSRTSVTWLSANTWGNGSIYGNIQFTFPWAAIVKDRDVYWVEAMEDYSPPAYRMILVDRDLEPPRRALPYNPQTDNGPLRLRNGQWYWNGNATSEFMVEADVSLELCTRLEFIKHHSGICRTRRPCPDAGERKAQTAGRLIAFILANEIRALDHVLEAPNIFDDSRSLTDEFDFGVQGIMRELRNAEFGGPIASARSSEAALFGVLSLIGSSQRRKARLLARVFKSRQIFEEALERAVESHFNLDRWRIPD